MGGVQLSEAAITLEADVNREMLVLFASAFIAASSPKKARRFLKELEKRALLQEGLTNAPRLRSSPASAAARLAKRDAAAAVLAILPLLASCVPP